MARGKPNPWMMGVLGVAVAAFLTDQLLAPASATDDAAVAATEAVAADDATGLAVRVDPGPTLSDRFSGFADQQPDDAKAIANAFAPLGSERSEEAVASTTADADAAEGLKLSAVLRRDDGNIAVINGRPLRVGQSLDGIRVISIDARTVRVKTTVGPITLTLDGPSLQSR